MPEPLPPTDPAAAAPPDALVRPRRSRARFLPFLIPLAAAAIALLLVAQSLLTRGPVFNLSFTDGHGLKPNDPVVYRGVQVGRIRTIRVNPAQSAVDIQVELSRDAAFLKSSACFWIVRPELSISRISGLETLFGPRYIAAAVLPAGESSAVAREGPPPLTWFVDAAPGSLIINIRAPRAASVGSGSPVSYREMPVGAVAALALAADARSVLMTVVIRPEHAHLVRANSVFWNVSGIGLDLGLVGGLKLKAESLQTIFAGGLAFATPDKPAEPATSGDEFPLGEFNTDALKWSPDLSVPK